MKKFYDNTNNDGEIVTTIVEFRECGNSLFNTGTAYKKLITIFTISKGVIKEFVELPKQPYRKMAGYVYN